MRWRTSGALARRQPPAPEILSPAPAEEVRAYWTAVALSAMRHTNVPTDRVLAAYLDAVLEALP